MDTRHIIKLMNNQIITTDEKNQEMKAYLHKINPQDLDTTYQNMTPLMEAANLGDVATLQALIEAKANVNARPESCLMPALHWAAHSGKTECVKLLIDAKANFNSIPHVNFGLSPLSLAAGLAAKATGDSSGCVLILLAAGAEINSLNPNEISIPDLYDSLAKCNEREDLTKNAFSQLLLLNQKENERLKKNNSFKNPWLLSKKTLLPEEIGHIQMILSWDEERNQDELMYSDIKKSMKDDPVGMKCLMM